ncbi:MAG: ribbon-helix-helix domain-containing protein [Nitrospiraceae bacterium]|nr:ribbon-helix-helix domain-containing protein [Nitrospiraceae bacterium]
MAETTKKQTGIRIEENTLKAVKHLAVDTGRSLSSLVTEAIEDLLKKYQKKSR